MSVQTAETREPKVNGVDVSAVENTVKVIKEKPDLAKSKFRAHNTWIEGGYNRSTINARYIWDCCIR